MAIKQINIPKPCHQQWQQMTLTDSGRYCDHCCKTVIDFTLMRNEEVIAYLSGNNKVCGRVNPQQLSGINNALNNEDLTAFSWRRWVAAASLAGLFNLTPAIARPVYKVEQTQPSNKKYTPLDVVADTARMNVKGKVIDENGVDALPGVIIKIKGTTIETKSNMEGYFALDVPLTAVAVEFVFIGYQKREIGIAELKNQDNTVKLSPAFLGEVVVIRRVHWTGRVWHKIKRLF